MSASTETSNSLTGYFVNTVHVNRVEPPAEPEEVIEEDVILGLQYIGPEGAGQLDVGMMGPTALVVARDLLQAVINMLDDDGWSPTVPEL